MSANASKHSKQKNDHDDAMSFLSFKSDLRSKNSNKTFDSKHEKVMLELCNDDIDLTDKQVVNLMDNLNNDDNRDDVKENEIDDFFDTIKGGDEYLKNSQG